MSGVTPIVDTLLATRLAQRPDLVPLKPQVKIAGPAAAARIDEIANDVRLPSRAALEQQLEVAWSGKGDGRAVSPPSGFASGVILSAVARAVNAILNPEMGPASRVRGSEPLWSQARPPLPHELTVRLTQTVTCSGLFYESHLQAFAAGLRSLEQMIREPQAGLGPSPLSLAPVDAAAPLVAARPGASPASVPSAALPAADAQAFRGESAQIAAAYGHDGRTGNNSVPFHEIAGRMPDAHSLAADPAGGLDSSAKVVAAIHPDAVGLVRQQLELLSMPVFRWCGEAWPGTPLEWDIGEEQAEDAYASGGDSAEPAWTTNLSLTLPTLKSVGARVILAGNTLQVRLTCDEEATLAVLHEGCPVLSTRLGSLGLQLAALQVSMTGAEGSAGLRKAQVQRA